MKNINGNQTVYQICKEYPQVADILEEIGFKDIKKPGMLQTAGRFMTLNKGAVMKKISTESMKEAFEKQGYNYTEE
ncbi:hypothetical protein acsn021_08780 [Anaerocolumna cellulosilytica]|uniref:Uncharacterized protein n=1 Tax=Anaerocolumna cellulosilytica TaxID=433286 RepID=A0A6S6QW70_9FIRM|nr:DUF1858 domain-containing protein [Anaerocolumna cellulosilytica]MBB5194366.1 hypothetical protein [Anaerocolumna cellulosilytica]BCJ93309.1 hypothetical protein acsn021_08780 [Anaerocolumna cellulosilytica]